MPSVPSFVRAAFVAALVPALPALVAAPSVAEDGTLRIPAMVAAADVPPTSARACQVEFDGFSPVVTDCPRECYLEIWDGPILRVVNACPQTAWVAYQYEDEAGRAWQTPCYRLPPGVLRSLPEPMLRLLAHRQVIFSTVPGEGYPVRGFRAGCSDTARHLPWPIDWLADRHRANVLRGPLADDALRR